MSGNVRTSVVIWSNMLRYHMKLAYISRKNGAVLNVKGKDLDNYIRKGPWKGYKRVLKKSLLEILITKPRNLGKWSLIRMCMFIVH